MLNTAISSAKDFLEATTQQQAADLINIQETLKKQGELVKSLTKTVNKGLSMANPHRLVDSSWPLLLQSGTCPGIVPSSSPPHHIPQTSNKLIQRISLASKQLLIDYGPKVPNDPPRDKSIEAQCKHRGMFSDWIDISLPQQKRARPPPCRPEQFVMSQYLIAPRF